MQVCNCRGQLGELGSGGGYWDGGELSWGVGVGGTGQTGGNQWGRMVRCGGRWGSLGEPRDGGQEGAHGGVNPPAEGDGFLYQVGAIARSLGFSNSSGFGVTVGVGRRLPRRGCFTLGPGRGLTLGVCDGSRGSGRGVQSRAMGGAARESWGWLGRGWEVWIWGRSPRSGGSSQGRTRVWLPASCRGQGEGARHVGKPPPRAPGAAPLLADSRLWGFWVSRAAFPCRDPILGKCCVTAVGGSPPAAGVGLQEHKDRTGRSDSCAWLAPAPLPQCGGRVLGVGASPDGFRGGFGPQQTVLGLARAFTAKWPRQTEPQGVIRRSARELSAPPPFLHV